MVDLGEKTSSVEIKPPESGGVELGPGPKGKKKISIHTLEAINGEKKEGKEGEIEEEELSMCLPSLFMYAKLPEL